MSHSEESTETFSIPTPRNKNMRPNTHQLRLTDLKDTYKTEISNPSKVESFKLGTATQNARTSTFKKVLN